MSKYCKGCGKKLYICEEPHECLLEQNSKWKVYDGGKAGVYVHDGENAVCFLPKNMGNYEALMLAKRIAMLPELEATADTMKHYEPFKTWFEEDESESASGYPDNLEGAT